MGTPDQFDACLPVAGQHNAVSVYGVYWNGVCFGTDYKAFVSNGFLPKQLTTQTRRICEAVGHREWVRSQWWNR